MQKLFFLLPVLCLCAGCALAPFRSPDAGIALETPTVVETLPCNPTTGYDWEAKWSERFCHVELRFIPPAEMMAGAPGKTEVVVTMHKPVKTRIVLEYRRCWEKDVPPAVQKTLIVKGVKP